MTIFSFAPQSAETYDWLVARLEDLLVQVQSSQGRKVKLAKAESEFLCQVAMVRDFLGDVMQMQDSRNVMAHIFGKECKRLVRTRAVLQAAHLSRAKDFDDRISMCASACDAVERIMQDSGMSNQSCRRVSSLCKFELPKYKVSVVSSIRVSCTPEQHFGVHLGLLEFMMPAALQECVMEMPPREDSFWDGVHDSRPLELYQQDSETNEVKELRENVDIGAQRQPDICTKSIHGTEASSNMNDIRDEKVQECVMEVPPREDSLWDGVHDRQPSELDQRTLASCLATPRLQRACSLLDEACGDDPQVNKLWTPDAGTQFNSTPETNEVEELRENADIGAQRQPDSCKKSTHGTEVSSTMNYMSDEKLQDIINNGVACELHERVLTRAYFLWKNGSGLCEKSNYMEALRFELALDDCE